MSFASFPLANLGLTPSQLSACERAGYSLASDILLASPAELHKKLRNLTAQNVGNIIQVVARSITPAPLSLASPDLVEEGRPPDREGWIGMGDEGLDEVLGGGIRRGVLTEISGESAAGKSHLSMSLAITAQIPSLTPSPGGTIILTSERELPTSRLVQLAQYRLASSNDAGLTVKHILDNIHTNRCGDIEALDHALSYGVVGLLKNQGSGGLMGRGKGQENEYLRDGRAAPLRLLILDSITALFRGSDTAFSSSASGLTQRSRYLCIVADKLKALAVEYDIAIVIINQVSDVFSPLPQGQVVSSTATTTGAGTTTMTMTQGYNPTQPTSSYYHSQFYTDGGPDPPMLYSTQSRWFSGRSDTLWKEASLGIVWANAVNVRIMLSRTGRRRRISKEDLYSHPKRRRRRRRDAGPDEIYQEEGNFDDPHGDVPRDGESGEFDLGIELEEGKPELIRRLHVVFSPFATTSTVDYILTTSGIHSLAGTGKIIDAASILKQQRAAQQRQKTKEGHLGDDDDDTGPDHREHNPGSQGGGRRGSDSDEFGGEVFDDLGDLPAEFWEGRFEADVEEPLAVSSNVL